MLVVDDEPLVCEIGRRFLREGGYGCVVAENVERALEMIGTTRVDAAILDVRLPGKGSGLDLLAILRQRAPMANIPVLIMTGSVLTEDEEAAITRQRGYLFYKPEGFDTIIKFLDQLTGRDRCD